MCVPRIERIGLPRPHFPYPFGGHRLIPGAGGDTIPDALDPATERRIAGARGRARTELHIVDVERSASF
ncbi:MAG: hypothetical protein ACT4P7_02815 [Gemmatimonadaceae bacterium]